MSDDPTRTAPPDATRSHDPDATVGQPAGEFAPSEEWTEIGRGAMGVVYKATQPGLNRAVAVKMLLGDDAPRHALRFLAEAEAVAAVDHPNVVKVFEFGRRDGRPFLAMEFLPGGTLADKFTSPLPPSDAAVLLRKIALGVGAAHAAGVVHRDLKPANVLFDAAGEPKVTDFGLAKRGGGADLTHTQAVMGTPAYMSPEQAKGETKFVGPPTDVWALGVILFEALTGTRPFTADDTWGLLQAVQTTEPGDVRTRRRDVPRDLAVIVAKCLRKDPAERYATANELAADLGRYAAGESILARPPGSVERALKWAARKPAVAAGWLLGVVAVVSLAVTGVTLKLKADADTARSQAEASEGEAKQARDAEQTARERAENSEAETNRAKEKLARAEYARTINLAHREYQRNDLKRADEYLNLCRADLRGWEWHYVHRLCHPEWEVIPEPLASDHQSFSADGMTFLTLKGGKVNVRHVEKGLIRSIDAGKETKWASLSPDATTIATGDGKTCQLWKSSGEKLRQIKHEQGITSGTFSGDGKEVYGLLKPPSFDLPIPSILPDEKREQKPVKKPEPYALAAVWLLGDENPVPRREWRVDPNWATDPKNKEKPVTAGSGPLSVTATGDASGVSALYYDYVLPLPAGRILTAGTFNLTVWSADEKRTEQQQNSGRLFTLTKPSDTLIGVRDGGLVGVAVADWKDQWRVSLGATAPNSLNLHPDGDRLCVGCKDGRVEVWSVKKKERSAEYRGFPLGAEVRAGSLSSDGRWVVAEGAGQVRVWRTDQHADRQEILMLVKKLQTAGVKTKAREPKLLACLCINVVRPMAEKPLYHFGFIDGNDLLDPTAGVTELRQTLVSRRFGPGVFLNPDRTLYFDSGETWRVGDNRLSVGQLGQQARKGVAHGTDDLLASWAVEGDDKTVIHIQSFAEYHESNVWKPGKKAERIAQTVDRKLPVGEPTATAVFAHSSHTLYVRGVSGSLSAWNADTGERVWSNPSAGVIESECGLAVSHDDKRVATNGAGSTLHVLDAASGAVSGTLSGWNGTVTAVCFSHDGRRIATVVAGELKLWDAESLQEVFTLDCAKAKHIEFRLDSDQLVVSSARNFMRSGMIGKWKGHESVTIPLVFTTLRLGDLIGVDTHIGLNGVTLTEQVFDARPVRAAVPPKK